MWAVIFVGNTKEPRVMSVHRSWEVAEETAAWIAYAGCLKERVYKGLLYDVSIEMPWSKDRQMYLLRHDSWDEILWVTEVERRT